MAPWRTSASQTRSSFGGAGGPAGRDAASTVPILVCIDAAAESEFPRDCAPPQAWPGPENTSLNGGGVPRIPLPAQGGVSVRSFGRSRAASSSSQMDANTVIERSVSRLVAAMPSNPVLGFLGVRGATRTVLRDRTELRSIVHARAFKRAIAKVDRGSVVAAIAVAVKTRFGASESLRERQALSLEIMDWLDGAIRYRLQSEMQHRAHTTLRDAAKASMELAGNDAALRATWTSLLNLKVTQPHLATVWARACGATLLLDDDACEDTRPSQDSHSVDTIARLHACVLRHAHRQLALAQDIKSAAPQNLPSVLVLFGGVAAQLFDAYGVLPGSYLENRLRAVQEAGRAAADKHAVGSAAASVAWSAAVGCVTGGMGWLGRSVLSSSASALWNLPGLEQTEADAAAAWLAESAGVSRTVDAQHADKNSQTAGATYGAGVLIPNAARGAVWPLLTALGVSLMGRRAAGHPPLWSAGDRIGLPKQARQECLQVLERVQRDLGVSLPASVRTYLVTAFWRQHAGRLVRGNASRLSSKLEHFLSERLGRPP